MATKNEVAKKKEQGITIFDPSIFEEDAGKGLENVGQEDLALPFVKVLSGNDPVLDENEDARKGDIYNTVTGKVTKGKPVFEWSRALINVVLYNGLLVVQAVARLVRSTHHKNNVLRPKGLLTITKTMWSAATVSTSKRRTNTLC